MIDKLSLITVLPELILLVMACVIALVDLRVTSKLRTVTHVLTLLTKGDVVKDVTAEGKPTIKLPSEHNGLAMVFLTFDKVSYALLLDVRTGVQVGDRLVNPQ